MRKIFSIILLAVLIFGYVIRISQADPVYSFDYSIDHSESTSISARSFNTTFADVLEHIQQSQPARTFVRIKQRRTIHDKYKNDSRVKKVRAYLNKRRAPLAKKAEYMVMTADKYGLDYRLIPAISVIESNGGKYTYRPHNAWGWGGAKGYSFRTWEEAINTVGKGLQKYYASGAKTPAQIAPAYNPHTPRAWASKVSFVMSQM